MFSASTPKAVLPLTDALLSPSEMFGRTDGLINSNDDDGLTISYTPATHVLEKLGGFLSSPREGKPLDIARDYLSAHAGDLGLKPVDIQNAIVTDQYTDKSSGVTHIYLRQTFDGLPIVGAEMGIHVMPDGRILTANSSFIPKQTETQVDGGQGAASGPQISADMALRSIALALGLPTTQTPVAGVVDGEQVLNASTLSYDPIPTEKKYFATADGPTLGWSLVVRPPNTNGDWYDMGVDSFTGQVVFASNWTDHAQYNVYALPTEAPNDGSRTLVTDPANATASPFGWHDTNGVAGAEFTITQGNNVTAYTDTDANNAIDVGSQPDGTASLIFNPALDLTQAPSTYRPAAVTNLFYWNNVIHDLHYLYGFTEAAGNFQVNNYGHGGSGSDPVLAEAQDGSGTNNANFATPPDGLSGRMQMYLWTSTTPNRDGDLDETIMTHEYGHGVSNRLTGGPANADALDNIQSGGMGEGWGDWWALMFSQKPTDLYATDGFGMATYVRGQPTTGVGLRRYRYSFTTSTDPLTIDAYGSGTSVQYGASVTRSTEVHASGEIWATTLWDMSVLLMNKYGYDPNLYTGYTAAAGPGHAGNKLALQLVMDALKLQPANPSFSQARDAILQADQALTGGANQAEIWQAFARRGMGIGFYDGGSSNGGAITPSFVAAPTDPVVDTTSPKPAASVIAASSMSFKFSEPMNPASFSLASDVTFTGPGGIDLTGTLTGSSFSADNLTLTVNFTALTATGNYSMTIGPNITAADNGHAMDQNLNGTSGEAGDSYTGTFTFSELFQDNGYGYQAGAWTYENLALTPGGPGVTSILTSSDDATVVIPMGTNSFRFYDNTYSATSPSGTVNACDNGFLSFAVSGSASVAFQNTDFTSPIAARFAPLWDDWTTDQDANDQVLYRFDDLNGDAISDRLVVEWHSIHPSGGNGFGSPVTFQAILQLNTGTTPGVMIANYVDIQSDNLAITNGASSSVGIKDTGTPPTGGNRLPVVVNDGTFPWLGDAKAIRVATDWVAPTVSSLSYSYISGPPSVGIQFSENVGASLALGDLTATNTSSGQVVPTGNMSLVYNGGVNNAATLTFPGYANGVPPDGNYTVVLNSPGLTDAQWNPLGGATSFNFFVLAGDADRTKTVDTVDFNILAANFGATGQNFSQGDFSYDTTVDTIDFNLLAANFSKTLPGDSTAAAAAPSVAGGSVVQPAAANGSSLFGQAPIKTGHLINELDPTTGLLPA